MKPLIIATLTGMLAISLSTVANEQQVIKAATDAMVQQNAQILKKQLAEENSRAIELSLLSVRGPVSLNDLLVQSPYSGRSNNIAKSK